MLQTPTEIVPTAYGGVDPGPAITTSQKSGTSAQGEATLDVTRSGSVAPGAAIDLVVATSASGGVGDDAQYLVDTTPVPVQVMSISFGNCEISGGSSGVDSWNNLFQTAATEGISVFVSSGDAGAAGCDTHNAAPPLNPKPISPNYICSSGYATCVGGTEFNDSSNLSAYWSSTNSAAFGSALGYIPEGAWNEPFSSGTTTQVAASGGGVSASFPRQPGRQAPAYPAPLLAATRPTFHSRLPAMTAISRASRRGGGSCVPDSQGGFSFEIFSGTSAAAPDMAGVAALLDQKLAGAQRAISIPESMPWPPAFRPHSMTLPSPAAASAAAH